MGRGGFGGLGLLEMVRELRAMGRSDDLLGRYRSFHALVEWALVGALGRCSVTYWCPDDAGEELIECVIRGRGEAESRRPGRVRLENAAVRGCLESGKAWLGTGEEGERPGCGACVPLFRPYGQPLLVVVQGCGRSEDGDREERFGVAVQLVGFFWEQLQAFNQRQWLADHDEASRALRASAFLEESQSWADRLAGRDEPFAVVVLTLRGFRSMFARNARQWQQLAGLVGQGLDAVLRGTGKRFLLGKTADDVFVLFLGEADGFLASSAMESLNGRLEREVRQDRLARALDVVAVELRWSVADHREYGGSMERLLNEVYGRLFSREGEGGEVRGSRIVLGEEIQK